jgi:hypothetical protein
MVLQKFLLDELENSEENSGRTLYGYGFNENILGPIHRRDHT